MPAFCQCMAAYIKLHFQRLLDIFPASVGATSDACRRTVQRSLDGPHIWLNVNTQANEYGSIYRQTFYCFNKD